MSTNNAYTQDRDQLAKLELLINNDNYDRYQIKMGLLTRLQLIEKVLEGRA